MEFVRFSPLISNVMSRKKCNDPLCLLHNENLTNSMIFLSKVSNLALIKKSKSLTKLKNPTNPFKYKKSTNLIAEKKSGRKPQL
jgi:hypothetical protein